MCRALARWCFTVECDRPRIGGLDHSGSMIDEALRQNRGRVAAGTAEFVVGDVTAPALGGREMMEAVGFTRVSTRRILRGYDTITAGLKA